MRLAMGKQNHFRSSVFAVAWIDLLGYGSMLQSCDFDPTSQNAKNAVYRLELLNDIASSHSSLKFPVLQMNDGIATWRELSFRTKNVTEDYIKRCIALFHDIVNHERNNGYPGPRMIISSGVRMKMKTHRKDLARERADRLIEQVESGVKDYRQALYQACNYNNYRNAVEELQANFAFSKSFIADEGGKAQGFGGSNIFIDMNFFVSDDIRCIDLSRIFEWNQYKGLESIFGQIDVFCISDYNQYANNDMATTIEIAKRILRCDDEQEVLARLRG